MHLVDPRESIWHPESKVEVKATFLDGSSFTMNTKLSIWHAMFKTGNELEWADFDKAVKEGRTLKIVGTVTSNSQERN